MMRTLLFACALLVPSAALAERTSPGNPATDAEIKAAGRREVIWDTSAERGPSSEPLSKIIYLNRCVGGCTITQGANNALTNTSSIPQIPTSIVEEFALGDALWDEVVACVRETYAPYDVEITDVDPGGVPHHEAIVAGLPANIGRTAPGEELVLGVGNGGCEPRNNVISFTFANNHPSDAEYMCATISQESGHTWGLDHVGSCTDPMTYEPACNQQFFRNQFFNCGEYEDEPRQCMCGGGRQNSHLRLEAVFGEGAPLDPPTLTIAAPTDGATVAAGFQVLAEAGSPRGLGHAELWINGYKWGEAAGDVGDLSKVFQISSNSPPDGVMDLEVRVYDDLERGYASSTLTVTQGAACTTADSCRPGQLCEDGRCFWEAPVGQLGEACEYPQYCVDGRCETGVCTRTCLVGIEEQCDVGYECEPLDASNGLCFLAPEEGGCCAVERGNRSSKAPWAAMGLVALVGGVVLGRRRRR